MLKTLFTITLVSSAALCLAAPKLPNAVVKEAFFTTDQARENIDSPATWHGPNGEHLLFATSKEGHSVNIFDAANGAMIQRLGGLGVELGQFNRPNGISVIDNLLLVVERDNRRVQVLRIPDYKPLATFGENELQKPYGLFVQPLKDGEYHVYVTDSYETADEQIPPDAQLNHRVRRYLLEVDGPTADAELDLSFGAIKGEGRLFVVESIFGDLIHNHLLIADELEHDKKGRQVKVYDFDGNYTGKSFGKGLFKFQVEGIALYQTSDTSGYWFVTDQGKTSNRFLVFDRESFAHLGTIEGERTLNTDGIWISQTPLPRFPKGVFFACDNDKAIAAIDLAEALQAIGLQP